MRAWRSGKQVDSFSSSSSVGVGGAVGGAFGEVKGLVGRVVLVVPVEVLLIVLVAGVSTRALGCVEGWCGVSM
jgi:hypothetical protein